MTLFLNRSEISRVYQSTKCQTRETILERSYNIRFSPIHIYIEACSTFVWTFRRGYSRLR